jgi:hypothetical protein
VPVPLEAPVPFRPAARQGPVALVPLAARQDRVVPAGPAMLPDRAAAARADKEDLPGRAAAVPVATPA